MRIDKSPLLISALALGVMATTAGLANPQNAADQIAPDRKVIAQSTTDQFGPNHFARELLQAHNDARRLEDAPPLKWNRELAIAAYEWAQQLAKEGRMRHANMDERGGAGENLWMGSAGQFSARFMVNAFVAERHYFKPGKFPDISRTGNWRDVGHYTQVVWKDTRELGCAVVRNKFDDFLVCRYWPAGNIYGAELH